jgi:predicted RNA-binding Zn ribbon-like protein
MMPDRDGRRDERGMNAQSKAPGRSETASRAATLPLVGSELAFDFTNTASGRGGAGQADHLGAAEHVVAWSRHAKVLTQEDGAAIERMIAGKPALGRDLLRRARELREVIHRIGSAIAHGGQPGAADTDSLARVHAACVARARLTPFRGNFVWSWRPAEGVAEAILGPIALSALTLLAQSDVSRIKQCAGDHCGWLFFDTTKNKQRRWCEMEVCGNRAKQKAHRARLATRAQIGG